jgi:hypothetical protein
MTIAIAAADDDVQLLSLTSLSVLHVKTEPEEVHETGFMNPVEIGNMKLVTVGGHANGYHINGTLTKFNLNF